MMYSISYLFMMGMALFGWLFGLSWIATGKGFTTSPLFAAIVVLILSASALTVLLGSRWWVKRQFCPLAIDHYHSEKYATVARILKQQASSFNVPLPRLHIYDADSLNAFVVGGIWQCKHLYLSEAVVTQLNRDEIEAVIAHELAHIYHRDMVVNEAFYGISMASISLIQQTFGRAMAYFVRQEDRVELSKQIAIVMSYGALLLPLWLLMLLYSRRSEYRADALASRIVGRQQYLGLLHRLKGVCRDNFFILDGQQGMLRHYFTSHPPLHHRISALEASQQA